MRKRYLPQSVIPSVLQQYPENMWLRIFCSAVVVLERRPAVLSAGLPHPNLYRRQRFLREIYGETLVSAQFSLYPLGAPDYMDRIYGAVDGAKRLGTFTGSKNFCTRLDGSAASVFQSIYESFISTPVSHVVIHATVSANSPSKKGEKF